MITSVQVGRSVSYPKQEARTRGNDDDPVRQTQSRAGPDGDTSASQTHDRDLSRRIARAMRTAGKAPDRPVDTGSVFSRRRHLGSSSPIAAILSQPEVPATRTPVRRLRSSRRFVRAVIARLLNRPYSGSPVGSVASLSCRDESTDESPSGATAEAERSTARTQFPRAPKRHPWPVASNACRTGTHPIRIWTFARSFRSRNVVVTVRLPHCHGLATASTGISSTAVVGKRVGRIRPA